MPGATALPDCELKQKPKPRPKDGPLRKATQKSDASALVDKWWKTKAKRTPKGAGKTKSECRLTDKLLHKWRKRA